MARLDHASIMTIQKLAELGQTNVSIATTLGVSEGSVRYHLKHPPGEGEDGRNKPRLAAALADPIRRWVTFQDSQGAGINLSELHDHLVEHFGYSGSVRSVQRYFKDTYPKARIFTRRRIETPPGAQAQVDWGIYPTVIVGGHERQLYGLHMQLSSSRYPAIVWSTSKNQLAWHRCHLESLSRLGGVPATIRVDNEKTAVVKGAGAWGVINSAYREFAYRLRFHVDACLPRHPQGKGKVERLVLTGRLAMNPAERPWDSLEELQEWTDTKIASAVTRMRCPQTGTSVQEAWEREQPLLTPLPDPIWEPFDSLTTRLVSLDCMVTFENRTYSVPFHLSRQHVEVRGCAETVQVFHDGIMVALHPRRSESTVLIDPSHYEGTSTKTVVAPMPLGRMGKRMLELEADPIVYRSIDYYHALAEVAR